MPSESRMRFSKRMRRYFAKKAAHLRANGNPAAAQAFMERWGIRESDLPTLDAKGKRRGAGAHIPATEDVPPPKREPISKHNVPRSAQ